MTFTLGNFDYKRPCGWKRIALNVFDKYDDITWLGVGRRQYLSDSVQWPGIYILERPYPRPLVQATEIY
ncbi:hypothetical protein C1645_832483 [Glomus cerebriforme]|uniref:Uncharacterized protein n=1 Tax=Glomus cerebriforme TaxID=658196 RepID=A0A397SJI0_9GLOM|nr:hypothetical protein C1645_832483 [Glomus cerebriforme]